MSAVNNIDHIVREWVKWNEYNVTSNKELNGVQRVYQHDASANSKKFVEWFLKLRKVLFMILLNGYLFIDLYVVCFYF